MLKGLFTTLVDQLTIGDLASAPAIPAKNLDELIYALGHHQP